MSAPIKNHSSILAIDVASAHPSIALLHECHLIAQLCHKQEKDRNQWLIHAIGQIKKIMRPHAIIVTMGPGNFTALRSSLALAHGLSLAWNIPLYGITTLYALALGAIQKTQTPHQFHILLTLSKSNHCFTQSFQKAPAPFLVKPQGDIIGHHDHAPAHMTVIDCQTPLAEHMAHYLAMQTNTTHLKKDLDVIPLYLKDHYAT